VEAFVKSLTAQLVDFELSEKALTELADSESKKLAELGGISDEADTLRKDIDDKRDLARSYRKRMDEVSLVGNRGGIVSKMTAEPAPGYQVEPKALPIALSALLGGLLFGVGLAWLAEVTDQSFRNPDDIRRRLKVPVLGHVPRIMPTDEEKEMAEKGLLPMDPSICAYYQPKSVDAEAFRGLRTTLFFKLEGEGHKIIQITSPNMGDGKTTLATNLAVSIAQSGKRILLVDADFRRPRLHKMFGLDPTTGLASVIGDAASLQAAIRPGSVPNLFLLPCGPRPNNPAELLTSQRFLDLLVTLREQFDIILVDTPPLLAVSDPSVIAPRVDGVLLTIRVAKNGRPAAERAREILTNLGANVYGVVVNGIDSGTDEGYGASQYGYTYHYAYGYMYDAADNNSYYHEEEHGDVAVNGTAQVNGAGGTNGATVHRRSRHRKTRSRGLIRWLRETLWH
jgi:capsular exopolysaccharide synthesis family protein